VRSTRRKLTISLALTAVALGLIVISVSGDAGGSRGQAVQNLYFPLVMKNYRPSQIAFLEDRYLGGSRYWDMYVINDDGSDRIYLTSLGKEMYYNPPGPKWSPDGSKIAFASYDTSNIHVINADGTGERNITNRSGTAAFPVWSPDGRKIAFNASDGIYIMNSDGTGQTKVVADLPEPYFNCAFYVEPAWSPDGRKIAFTAALEGSCQAPRDIYVVDLSTLRHVNLTNHTADDWGPTWAPDGSRILFYSNRDGNWEIYVMNTDGTGQTNLTNNPGCDGRARFPAWSPDGSRIAFDTNRDGNWEVYVMNADGSGQTNLTNNSGWDAFPAWSADGRRIAFYSTRDSNGGLYVMNADGTRPVRLTSMGPYHKPAWRP